MSRVLVVVAHADELAFHAGGTIAKLVAQNHEVYQVVVTTGAEASFSRSKGEMEPIIREEARQSADLLGLEDAFLWSRENVELSREQKEQVVAWCRRDGLDELADEIQTNLDDEED